SSTKEIASAAGVGYARSHAKSTPYPGGDNDQSTGQNICQLDPPTAPRPAPGAADPHRESGGRGRADRAQQESASGADCHSEPLGREPEQLFEHVQSKIGPFGIFLNLMTPFSRCLGPDLHQDTVGNVLKAGFRLRREENVYLDIVKIIEAV